MHNKLLNNEHNANTLQILLEAQILCPDVPPKTLTTTTQHVATPKTINKICT